MQQGLFETSFLGTKIPLHYVTDKTYALNLIHRLMQQSDDELYAIDTETYALPEYKDVYQAALSPHLAKVRLIQLYTGRSAIVFDCLKIGDDSIFKKFLETKKFVFHNAVFDIGFFYKWFGIEHIQAGCTYLIAKLVIHATSPTDEGLSASLKNLVNILFKSEIRKEMQTSNWGEPELTFEQVEYAGIDAIATYFLAQKLATKLTKYGLERIYKLYKEAQHPIAKMQLNGLGFNVEAHRDMIVSWRADLYKAKKELVKLTGLEKITGHTVGAYLEKTLPKDVLSMWPRTETGKLATDAHVFADFDFIDLVKPFTEFQKREKLCTSFGNSLIEQINPATSRLHAQYRLAGARTGRLSCSNPNLQQLPRDNSIRANFVPKPGKLLLCADYSQIEIRIGAELSRDKTMLKAYQEGVDLHSLTASLISHKNIKDVTKEDRQKAKAFNFGLMFGLGARKFSHYAKKSYGATVSQEEAEEGVSTFRDTYYGYHEWQMNQSEFAIENGFVSTPCGKRRCLDPKNSYGASMNTPIQGGAAECMLYSLIILNKKLHNIKGASLVNCVHDEVLVESEVKDEKEVKRTIEEAMVEGFMEVFPHGITRGLVECHGGKNWAAAKSG